MPDRFIYQKSPPCYTDRDLFHPCVCVCGCDDLVSHSQGYHAVLVLNSNIFDPSHEAKAVLPIVVKCLFFSASRISVVYIVVYSTRLCKNINLLLYAATPFSPSLLLVCGHQYEQYNRVLVALHCTVIFCWCAYMYLFKKTCKIQLVMLLH